MSDNDEKTVEIVEIPAADLEAMLTKADMLAERFDNAYAHAQVRGYGEEYAIGYATIWSAETPELNGMRDALRDIEAGRDLDPEGVRVIHTEVAAS